MYNCSALVPDFRHAWAHILQSPLARRRAARQASGDYEVGIDACANLDFESMEFNMKLFMLSSRDAVLDPEHAFIPAHQFATPLAEPEIELNRVSFFGCAGARGRRRGRAGGRRGGRLGGARRPGNGIGGAPEGHDGLPAGPSEVSDSAPMVGLPTPTTASTRTPRCRATAAPTVPTRAWRRNPSQMS